MQSSEIGAKYLKLLLILSHLPRCQLLRHTHLKEPFIGSFTAGTTRPSPFLTHLTLLHHNPACHCPILPALPAASGRAGQPCLQTLTAKPAYPACSAPRTLPTLPAVPLLYSMRSLYHYSHHYCYHSFLFLRDYCICY